MFPRAARAECEFLRCVGGSERAGSAIARARDTAEQSAVACLQMDLYVTLGQSSRAIGVALEYLRQRNTDWPAHPTEEQARSEYERFWSQLGRRKIEDLIELPLMTDPESLATLDVLMKLQPAALHTDINLLALGNSRIANLSLEHGVCAVSCVGFVGLGGRVAGPQFGDYDAGHRFGRLGYDLVEQRGLKRFDARCYIMFAQQVLPWTEHVRAGRDLVRRVFEVAHRSGDLSYAAYSGTQLTTNLLAAGDPLLEAQREAENALAFAQKLRLGGIDRMYPRALIRTFEG